MLWFSSPHVNAIEQTVDMVIINSFLFSTRCQTRERGKSSSDKPVLYSYFRNCNSLAGRQADIENVTECRVARSSEDINGELWTERMLANEKKIKK